MIAPLSGRGGRRIGPAPGEALPKEVVMSRRRRTMTEAEREERRREDRERLADAVAELRSSAGWQRWLRTRAVFHNYSLNNTLLLSLQCCQRGIEPTYIAGFRAWLKLGRCVRKGETGLAIAAPMSVKEQTHDAEGNDSEERRTFFRIVKVFDVSQTDPLPDIEPVPLDPPGSEPVSGDSHAHLIPVLRDFAGEVGYTIEFVDELPDRPAGALGTCNRGKRAIRVLSTLPANQQVEVEIHELCHALVGDTDPRPTLTYDEEEVAVEAATYVACSAAGLATDVASVPYIAGWADDDSDAGAQLEKVAALIDTLAKRIEEAIDKSVTDTELAIAAA